MYPYKQRKKGRAPFVHSMYTHPWGSFAITFIENRDPKWWRKTGKTMPAYTVDKAEFIAKLQEWNVHIDNEEEMMLGVALRKREE